VARPLLIGGVPRAANWMLAALLATSAIASPIALGATWPAGLLTLLIGLLAVGVLLRAPVAYLCVATLSFLSLAGAMQQGDFVLAAGNGLLFVLALFVRSQLKVERASAPG
jgi:hypothetical protein